MTPVLAGRLQTRLFIVCTVGVLWTALVTPLLPVPSGVGVGGAYRMTFGSLGLMAVLGLVWELLYHLLQQARWDKDWPTLLGLVTVVNEAIPLWFVARALGVVPADAAPFVLPFAIDVGTTWLLMWLFLQGPVRVLHIRWRFEGGRVFLPAPGRWRRQDDWLDTRWFESLRAAARPEDTLRLPGEDVSGDVVDIRRTGGPADSLVDGVLCPRGHFGSADAPYCPVCGAMRTESTVVRGPRPPVGVLILADGTTRTVDEDLLLVRTADGIEVVPHTEESAGDVLADLVVVGWQPVLFGRERRVSVVLPGGNRLTTAAGVPVPLVAGSVVAVDEYTIRYESPYAVDPDDAVDAAGKEGVPVAVGGSGWTRGARRAVAVAAAVAAVTGVTTFVLLSGSSGESRSPEAGGGPGAAPLPSFTAPSFSVPPFTLPSRPVPSSGAGLPTLALPSLPSGDLPSLGLGGPVPTFVSPPGGVVLPPPPSTGPRPTTRPVPTTPAPRPPAPRPTPPPIAQMPTTSLCTVGLMGLLQCVMGPLGG